MACHIGSLGKNGTALGLKLSHAEAELRGINENDLLAHVHNVALLNGKSLNATRLLGRDNDLGGLEETSGVVADLGGTAGREGEEA